MEIGTKTLKLNWKQKTIFAIVNGISFIGFLCLLHYIIDGELQSSFSYIFQGVFFGIFMTLGLPYVNKIFGKSSIGDHIKPALAESEEIEVEGPANLFRGFEGVGGKIFLTNKKMIFKSHRLNIQRGQTDIEYENISVIIKRKTAKLFDNGIRIITNDGKEFDFVVNERDLWVEKINEKIKI